MNSDPSTIYFSSISLDATLEVNATAGDLYNVTGNFTDLIASESASLAQVTLDFQGGGTHDFTWSSHGSIGTVELASGDSLQLNLNGHLFVTNFLLGGGVAQLSALTFTGSARSITMPTRRTIPT